MNRRIQIMETRRTVRLARKGLKMSDFLISLIANRYTLGTAAVAIFAYPVIQEAAEILQSVANTLATIPGIGQ